MKYSEIKRWFKRRFREGTLSWSVLRHVKNLSKYLVTLRITSLIAYARREFFLRNSIFLFEDELFMASIFPRQILELTVELFKPKSVLDLGCGTGKALDFFLSKGIDAIGIEGSSVAIAHACNPGRIRQFNLEQPLDLNRKFDLVWSFEFVEHIRPRFVDNLLRSFSNHAAAAVLSAARPGQGGVGHFNEQPESYWIDHFRRFGFGLDKQRTDELRLAPETFARNIMVFVKPVLPR